MPLGTREQSTDDNQAIAPSNAATGQWASASFTLGGDAESADRTRVGRYEIRELLGAGGFADVYLANDAALDRLVALKVMRRSSAPSKHEVDCALNEARIVASLDHPGIVPVYDIGQTEDGAEYIVMKLVDGGSLSSRLKSGNKLAPERSARIVAAAADAVHQAHLRGIFHRDLKPSNILLDLNGAVYVGDFGLAVREATQRALGDGLTGTLPYMSPEQTRGEVRFMDGRADVWALGAIFYECLTGRPPFRGRTVSETIDEIQHREPKPPRMIDDSIPHALEAVCLKALSKKVASRFITAKDMGAALREATDGFGVESQTSRRPNDKGSEGTADDRNWHLLNQMWDLFDDSLQDAFALAYNKKRRSGSNRISTQDLFLAFRALDNPELRQLLDSLLPDISSRLPRGPVSDQSGSRAVQLSHVPNPLSIGDDDLVPEGAWVNARARDGQTSDESRDAPSILNRTRRRHAAFDSNGDVTSAKFDPYHRWLAIPPEEQPPNHYRLLGVRPFETDEDVISAAVDQRMMHLRSFQTGPHAAESQRLLNEVAHASRTLLDPDDRRRYDAALGAGQSGRGPSLGTATVFPEASAPAGNLAATVAKLADESNDLTLLVEDLTVAPVQEVGTPPAKAKTAKPEVEIELPDLSADLYELETSESPAAPAAAASSRWARTSTLSDARVKAVRLWSSKRSFRTFVGNMIRGFVELCQRLLTRVTSAFRAWRAFRTAPKEPPLVAMNPVEPSSASRSVDLDQVNIPGSSPEHIVDWMAQEMEDDITARASILTDPPLLSDCVAESLRRFSRCGELHRKLSPADIFVDIGKFGHGPSVARLREHGIGPTELDQQVRTAGLLVQESVLSESGRN